MQKKSERLNKCKKNLYLRGYRHVLIKSSIHINMSKKGNVSF